MDEVKRQNRRRTDERTYPTASLLRRSCASISSSTLRGRFSSHSSASTTLISSPSVMVWPCPVWVGHVSHVTCPFGDYEGLHKNQQTQDRRHGLDPGDISPWFLGISFELGPRMPDVVSSSLMIQVMLVTHIYGFTGEAIRRTLFYDSTTRGHNLFFLHGQGGGDTAVVG